MTGKIKFYQDDNLRLSNEVAKLSNKLENTRNQLRQFESNKVKLVSQLKNLNNIVSENNVIGNPFDLSITKTEKLNLDLDLDVEKEEDKVEKKKEINTEEQKQKNLFRIETPTEKSNEAKELDLITKKIFQKE